MTSFKGTEFKSWFSLEADKIIFLLKEIKNHKEDFTGCPFLGK